MTLIPLKLKVKIQDQLSKIINEMRPKVIGTPFKYENLMEQC